MKQTARNASGILLSVLLCLAGCQGAHSHELVLREVSGAEHRVFPMLEGKATVVLFTATDCPISNTYAPEVERIRAEYEPQGIDFFLVYGDRDETPEKITQHLADFSYGMPGLLDFEQRLIQHTGATVTPEAAVLDQYGELLYRGRIDDTFVAFGKQRAQPTRRDLRLALDDILAGRSPEVGRTETIGCFIPDITPGTSTEGDACCAE